MQANDLPRILRLPYPWPILLYEIIWGAEQHHNHWLYLVPSFYVLYGFDQCHLCRLSVRCPCLVTCYSGFDFNLNMLVMFSFIFALGIVVDDALWWLKYAPIFTKTEWTSFIQPRRRREVFVPIFQEHLHTGTFFRWLSGRSSGSSCIISCHFIITLSPPDHRIRIYPYLP